jgi:MFS family permease
MISVLLASAFISRQAWGAISDRVGGLRTLLVGSACQTVAAAAFLFTQEEIGLVAVTVAFGFGFSGLIPAYILTVRELFPAREAFWRIPTVLLVSSAGMATGGWLAGALYDHFFFYGPAFAVGAAFGIANLALLCVLVWRQSSIVAQLLSRGQET